ncbi:cell wall-binding repeat-containing protein [Georgenia yuyongxinii]|uniref:DUF1524 domain-containing protein n=1 Tax=Georgenia yuyongxinii TaxID=2589797 RepID=A0A552WNW5_9MICO|nr:cell wall-binding repeat-containing protein [Georgenia yuyongxinii]TRW44384.1 DUF1524 domain-containing protein [Georgenia yuyongxinii]
MRNSRRAVAALIGGLAAAALTVAGVTPATAATSTIDRQSGGDRWGTAANISARTFPGGASTVYVASGRDYPDALAGAPVAAIDVAPVLLVDTHSIPAATRTELGRLNPDKIVVLGGSAAISDAVYTALSEYGTVSRLHGGDRYATAANISAAAFDEGVPVAYVASGRGYADALAGTPVAGRDDAPILLVDTNTVPDTIKTELGRLKPGRIVVLGGSSVVSDAVLTQLRQYTSGSVTRQYGGDRYATAVDISKKAFPNGASTVYLASGLGFPDALAGAPAAGIANAPILLVQPGSIPDVVLAEIKRLAPTKIVVLGGTSAISDAVAKRAADPNAPVATGPAAAALAALDGIRVTTIEAPGYDRDLFGNEWIDQDGDKLDTRNEILARDLKNVVIEDRSGQKVVTSGVLNDPYTGKTINFVRGVGTSNAVQIDHIVSVSAAWKMGANAWTTPQRINFYNDFDNLLAVDGPTNASKGDKTLGEWQPPNAAFRCEYAITYIEVTDEYDLALKPVDVSYARQLLPSCTRPGGW